MFPLSLAKRAVAGHVANRVGVLRRPRWRFELLLALVLSSSTAHADWTGVFFELADVDSDWVFDSGTREARINKLSFRAEEKTASGLRAGFNLGLFDMRVVADTPDETKKFNGEFLGIFLRLPVPLGKRVMLHGWLDYTYHGGRESGSPEDAANLDWSEAGVGVGVSARFSNLRLMPYVEFGDIDGDIQDDTGTRIFEQDEARSQGLKIDLFLEPSAYIRFEFVDGGHSGGYLTFVREY